MSDAGRKDKEPAVFLHAIKRRYHQGAATLEILTGAELAVWPGQSVALIAPSGTGKSTLLHIAGLLEHPDAGEVYVDGRKKGISPPLTEVRLAPGKHDIEIRNTTFPRYVQSVNLEADAQVKVKHKFQ